MPNTKIVATLGPATDAPGVLRQLLAAGVDVFRLNASHGAQDDHAGRFEEGHAMLETGATFTITTEPVMGSAERASTGYSGFAHDVRPGDRILLADGSIELLSLESDGTSVRTRVVSGGPIGDHKGINLPGVQVSIPSLTEKDL